MSYRMSRSAYADTYGPTVGDRVRLADVEQDYTRYGDEVKFGGVACSHSTVAAMKRSTRCKSRCTCTLAYRGCCLRTPWMTIACPAINSKNK